MTLSGTNTLQSGGILVTPASGGGTIAGGTLDCLGRRRVDRARLRPVRFHDQLVAGLDRRADQDRPAER